MIHGDDKGLVLPPKVAQTQIVIVPIAKKNYEENIPKAHEMAAELTKAGLRAHVDDRKGHNPGFKYNHWELRGVPIRLEIGERDMQNQQVRVVERWNGAKTDISWDNLADKMKEKLDEINAGMLKRASDERNNCIVKVTNRDEIMPALNDKKMLLCPWCETVESEEDIKKWTKEESEKN